MTFCVESRISRAGASSTLALLADAALRGDIEDAHAFDLVAEQFDADGRVAVLGKTSRMPPRRRELAGPRHGVGRLVAHLHQPRHDVFDVYGLPGFQGEEVGHQVFGRRWCAAARPRWCR